MTNQTPHLKPDSLLAWETDAFSRPLPHDPETTEKRLQAMRQVLGMLRLQGTQPDAAFLRAQEYYALGVMDAAESRDYLTACYAQSTQQREED